MQQDVIDIEEKARDILRRHVTNRWEDQPEIIKQAYLKAAYEALNESRKRGDVGRIGFDQGLRIRPALSS